MTYKKEFISTICRSPSCAHRTTCALLKAEIVKTNTNNKIDIMFVGQGAGEQEALTQRPFVGPAGKVLREEIKPFLDRGINIILDNTVKCRPTDENGKNRAPIPSESNICINHLWKTISDYAPKIIVTLGASATGDVITTVKDTPISGLRGKVIKFRGNVIIPTYHPAACLHAKGEKAEMLRNKLRQDIAFAYDNAMKY